MILRQRPKSVWFLAEVGLEVSRKSGHEWICTCPVCGKEEHLYFNDKKLVYDCKVCDAAGSYPRLLDELARDLLLDSNCRELRLLAKDRKLPVAAFDGIEIGFTGRLYTLSIRNIDGRLTDLRRFNPGDKCLSAPDCNAGLFGAEKLGDRSRSKQPVYVAEGEWDALGFAWLLRSLREPGVVVAVRGANTFKSAWIEWFRDRKVALLYDNDEAGRKGQARARAMLEGVAASVRCIQWREDDPRGCDLRDLIGGLK